MGDECFNSRSVDHNPLKYLGLDFRYHFRYGNGTLPDQPGTFSSVGIPGIRGAHPQHAPIGLNIYFLFLYR